MKKILPLFLFIALCHTAFAQKIWPQEQLKRLWTQRNPELLAQYERLRPVTNYLSICEKNGKTGLVDSTGKVILKPRYDFGYRYQDKAIIIMGNDGKKGAYNFLGECILPIKYTQLIPFKTLLWATTATDTLIFTTAGKPIHNPKLEKALSSDSREGNSYFSAFVGPRKWGILNTQGDWVIRPVFNYIHESYANGDYWTGLTDTGQVLLHPSRQWQSYSSWNTIQVVTPNGFWAKKEDENTFSFYNFEEKKAHSVLELDDPGYSSSPRIVTKDGKKGIMTADTTTVLPPVFEDIRDLGANFDSGYLFAVKDAAGVRYLMEKNGFCPNILSRLNAIKIFKSSDLLLILLIFSMKKVFYYTN